MPSLPPSVTLTLEEKVAKLCVRRQLKSDVLPRFVMIMLEHALHMFMCSFAACFMQLIKMHRRGELEPWPDDAEDEAWDEPRVCRYKQKSTPAAPSRSAGATREQSAAAMADISEIAERPGAAHVTQRPVPPRLGGGRKRRQRLMPRMAARIRRAPDRCRSALFFSAAGERRENCV